MAYKLIIVGGGRMGSALAAGLRRANWCAADQPASPARSVETRKQLEERFSGVGVFASIEQADIDPDTGAVLSVKPDYAEGVARTCGMTGITRLLSVVAGLSTQRLEAVFPQRAAVV